MRLATAVLIALALLPLAACTDSGALGAIPSDSPGATIDTPSPTPSSDTWFSNPVAEKPDWGGMYLGDLKINGDQYSYLDVAGDKPRYRNVAEVPLEVGSPEPRIDPAKPLVVEFQSKCRSEWLEPPKKQNGKADRPAVPELLMFIAKSEDAVDGVPVFCTTDNLNYEGMANSWAWFIDTNYGDGNYFIVTTVKGSRWRQVVPLTISTGILNRQGAGLGKNGIWDDPRANALPGEQGVIDAWPLVTKSAPTAKAHWWVAPQEENFFSASDIKITGSGTNSDPITGSFAVTLSGEHRSARTNTWVLGRDKDATHGPELSCASESNGKGSSPETHFKCDIRPFVDARGKTDAYYLILTSQPGGVRQVIKLPMK
ncbi:hypothetical protein [Microbacterium capsulatum]|uniref:Lipoprotein n=1 Tax=Microbacterium capsulatum TaxID=3041921 RepID=A0ABU0XG18_9MICO|nr:hypothetical protein [Microbacterium sp. ASV81]MDQ4214066.1 hypothetical protein [Microbacterium sp. ASV81]